MSNYTQLLISALKRPLLKDLPDPYLVQEDKMEIHAIIQSIKDETDEQVEKSGVYAIPHRIRELAGMLEVLQLLDSTPAILCGSIMAMQETLEKQYKHGFARPSIHY